MPACPHPGNGDGKRASPPPPTSPSPQRLVRKNLPPQVPQDAPPRTPPPLQTPRPCPSPPPACKSSPANDRTTDSTMSRWNCWPNLGLSRWAGGRVTARPRVPALTVSRVTPQASVPSQKRGGQPCLHGTRSPASPRPRPCLQGQGSPVLPTATQGTGLQVTVTEETVTAGPANSPGPDSLATALGPG